MLFLGEFDVAFSGKGRLVIPKKIRSACGQAKYITLTKGYDGCLAGYREDEWARGTAELLQQKTLYNEGLGVRRHFFSSAVVLEIDEQGRVVMPQNLLLFAGLEDEKEAMIIGVGDHFEIWEKKRYEVYRTKNEQMVNKEYQ